MRELFNSSPVSPDHKKRDLEERLATPVAPLEEQQAAVTPQEWKFIQELVDGEGKQTLKQAALSAGYDPARASIIAHELTDPRKNPQIVAAIQQYRRDMADKYGTNIERHLRDMQIIRDKALEAGNYSAAVMAEYRRGQALGTIYVDRKEIRHGTIDSMSADEVRRKLEEIKALYGGPPSGGVIEVIPEAPTDPEEAADPVELTLEQIKDAAQREHPAQLAARDAEDA